MATRPFPPPFPAFAALLAAATLHAAPLDNLKTHLALPPASRPAMNTQPWSTAPLTKQEAESAKDLRWQDYLTQHKPEAQKTIDTQELTLNNKTLLLKSHHYGTKPEKGWPLYISLHGGGSAPKSVNDQQWSNQHRLYELKNAIVVAPRAPSDAWNMWFTDDIDDLFDRLVRDYVIAGEVDPNRIYLTGYSAGGDGVYQLAPRMADRFAAAAMMAGHPNDANPLSLRNLPFAIHVGALDTAFNRNKVAQEWGQKLDTLQAADPTGYIHQFQLHEGRPHWMNKEEQPTMDWMAGFTRNPWPKKVTWHQSNRPHNRLYWLTGSGFDKLLLVLPGAEISATITDQTLTLDKIKNTDNVAFFLDDQLLNLDQPITVKIGSITGTLHPRRTICVLAHTLDSHPDRNIMASCFVPFPLALLRIATGGSMKCEYFTFDFKNETPTGLHLNLLSTTPRSTSKSSTTNPTGPEPKSQIPLNLDLNLEAKEKVTITGGPFGWLFQKPAAKSIAPTK